MPTLSLRTLRTLCLCVKPSPLSPLNCRRSAVGSKLSPPPSPLFATLTPNEQLTESKATLSPFPAALTRHVKPKSFIFHSYEKHRGAGESVRFFARYSPPGAPDPHSNARNSNSLMRLLHNSLSTGGVGVCPPPSTRKLRLPPPCSTLTSHQSADTSHKSPITSHEPTHL